MNDNRFTIEESENQLIIFDNGVSDETYFHLGNDERDVKYVCGLLNEQQTTISQLQEEIKLLKPTNIEQYEQIVQLQEENEQLRQILKDIVGATDETYTKNTSMFKVTVVFDGKMYNQIKSCLK